MIPKKIFYHIGQAFKSMGRNKLMSFSTILTVAISLFIVGTFAVFVINASDFIESQSNKTKLAVFIDTSYTLEQAQEVGKKLEEISGIESIEYISKEDAMKKTSKKYGGEEQWKEVFGDENPLPYTYNITAVNSRDLEGISNVVKSIPGVYKADYAKNLVVQLVNIVKSVRVVGIAVIVILFLSAIFLISTTIKLSVYAKRKEIMVMKYVGSSNSFIRGPFVITGLLLGFMGAIVATLILFGTYYYVMTYWIVNISFLQLSYDPIQISIIIGALFISGIIIGIIGSIISLRKYLNV